MNNNDYGWVVFTGTVIDKTISKKDGEIIYLKNTIDPRVIGFAKVKHGKIIEKADLGFEYSLKEIMKILPGLLIWPVSSNTTINVDKIKTLRVLFENNTKRLNVWQASVIVLFDGKERGIKQLFNDIYPKYVMSSAESPENSLIGTISVHSIESPTKSDQPKILSRKKKNGKFIYTLPKNWRVIAKKYNFKNKKFCSEKK